MWNRGSAVECAFTEAVLSSSIPEKCTFCWIGYLARDIFKHSIWNPDPLPECDIPCIYMYMHV